MKRLFITAGRAWSLGIALSPLPLDAAPQWIWVAKQAKNGEKATFRKTFTVAGPVASAKLNFTCDNGATAYLNGTKVADNPDWGQPTVADLKHRVSMAFEGTEPGAAAGGLRRKVQL
jgi:hypothetical protein